MAGEQVDGVAFAHGASVEIVAGAHAGARGRVLLLLAVRPEPRYLVHVAAPGTDAIPGATANARLAQSMLAPAAGA